MLIEEVCASVFYPFLHHVHISLVECGCPDSVFVCQSVQQVAGSGCTVPDIIFILPVFSQFIGKILLRQLHPFLRCEKRTFALSDVGWHEQISTFNDIIPIVTFGRAVVAVPKLCVRFLFVDEICGAGCKEPKVVLLPVKLIISFPEQYK